MYKSAKAVITACTLSALILLSYGCQKTEGPAERAGKQVDQAVDKAGQEIQRAGEKIQDATKDAKK